MANDIASQATWQINSASQGNKKLQRVQTWDVASGGSVEAVNEAGNDVPVGFMIKPGAFTVTFNIKETKSAKREVDWEKLDATKEIVSLTKQVKFGQRQQFPECMVSKIDYTGDSDAKLEYTVEIVALTRKAL